MRTRVETSLGYVLIFLLAIMAMDILWGVATRYVMKSQADWTEELARFLLIWLSILGAAYASGKRTHLAIDLLLPKLNVNNKRRAFLFINILVLLFVFTVLVIGGSRLMYITAMLGQNSAALQIPIALVYSVLPLGGFLIVYFKIDDIRHVRDLVSA